MAAGLVQKTVGDGNAGSPGTFSATFISSDGTTGGNLRPAMTLYNSTGTEIVFSTSSAVFPLPTTPVSGVTASMTSTTSTSLLPAPGASLHNYVTCLIVDNSHATVGTDVLIQDGSGGTTLMSIPAAAVFGGAVIALPTPLKQPTANTALFCANVTTGSAVRVTAVGFTAA